MLFFVRALEALVVAFVVGVLVGLLVPALFSLAFIGAFALLIVDLRHSKNSGVLPAEADGESRYQSPNWD